MDPCWTAPESDLCTTTCKDQLEKLPNACVSGGRGLGRGCRRSVSQRLTGLPLPTPRPSLQMERLASDVVKAGNANVTARLEDQLEACGYANLTAFSGAWGRGVLLAPAALGLSAALLTLLG